MLKHEIYMTRRTISIPFPQVWTQFSYFSHHRFVGSFILYLFPTVGNYMYIIQYTLKQLYNDKLIMQYQK